MQQRAFTAAGIADDAEKLAGVNLKVQPGQHRHLDRMLAIGLVDIDRRHQGEVVSHRFGLQKKRLTTETQRHREDKKRMKIASELVFINFALSSLCLCASVVNNELLIAKCPHRMQQGRTEGRQHTE